MGLLRWLKKNKSVPTAAPPKPPRRQSDSMFLHHLYNYDPNCDRDSYLRAFEQFQGRRSDAIPPNQPPDTLHDMANTITDLYSTVNRRPQTSNNHNMSSANGGSNHSYAALVEVEQYLKGKAMSRHSQPPPAMAKLILNNNNSSSPKKMGKSKKKRQAPSPNNCVILENEVKEFEITHCNNNNAEIDHDHLATSNVCSPPSRFFKINTNPFPSPTLPPKQTNEPMQRCAVFTKPLNSDRRDAPMGSGVGASDEPKDRQVSVVNLDIHSVSSTEGDIRLDGGGCNMANDDGEGSSSGICSGGSSSEPLDNLNVKLQILDNQNLQKSHRSFRYEQEVNKYGDVVDYAMPQMMVDNCNGITPVDTIGTNRDSAFCDAKPTNTDHLADEMFVDNNFDFLNECQPSYVLASHLRRDEDLAKPAAVRVTDLDESTDANLTANSGIAGTFNGVAQLCHELSSLEHWSDTLRQRNNSMEFLDKYKSAVALCKPKDIRYTRTGAFGSRLPSQLEFSCGSYRRTDVLLRKCNPRIPEAVRLVEEAIEKDYNILRSEIKHPNIVLLMAACYNKKLINHMILVLEPCKFTFNYFLHELNAQLSLDETILLVQQIGSAVQYLHQFGYIHSNISSHCVLISNQSEGSLTVKLSSFELVTSMKTDAIRQEIESRFENDPKSLLTPHSAKILTEHSLDKQRDKATNQNYGHKSKQPVSSLVQPNKDHSYLAVSSEFLAYNANFRQHLSLFNYQAPELLVSCQDFVFPTVESDVYALTLLLWEALNKVVPYVVYSKYELQCLLASGEVFLPILEAHRCCHFIDIFVVGLKCDPLKRKLGLDDFLDKLNVAKIHCENDNIRRLNESSLSVNHVDYVNHQRRPPIRRLRSPSVDRVFEMKPMLSLPMMGGEVNLKMRRSRFVNHQTQKALNQTTSSTLSDFSQALSSQLMNDGRPERTSTMKTPNLHVVPKSKSNDAQNIQTPIKRCPIPTSPITPQTTKSKMSPKSALSVEKSNFLNKLLDSAPISSKSPTINNFLDDVTTPDRNEDTKNQRQLRNNLIRSAPQSSNSYRFDVGDFVLPDTPIARENKIRRNAWLSNQRLNFEVGDVDTCARKDVGQMTKSATPGGKPSPKKVNVNIRIVHTKISPIYKTAASNSIANNVSPRLSCQHQSWSFGTNRRKSVDTDNAKLRHKPLHKPTKLSYSESMLKKPEAIEVESEQRTKNVTSEFLTCLETNSSDNVTEDFLKIVNDLELNSNAKNTVVTASEKRNPKQLRCQSTPTVANTEPTQSIDEEKSQWTPVKSTIMQFENWLALNKSHSPFPNSVSSPARSPRNVMITPRPSTAGLQHNVSNSPKPDCFRASSSPSSRSHQQQLMKRTICTETIVSGMDYDAGGDQRNDCAKEQTISRKQLTTHVTINLRQTQRQPSFGPIDQSALSNWDQSDRLARLQQVCHSIGGNELSAAQSQGGTAPSGISTEICIPGGGTDVEIHPRGRHYVCNNCAETIPHTELKALMRQDSIASSVMDPRLSDIFRTPLQRCLMIGSRQTIRSTEDFYIDDDFATGLGANMELVSDTSDLFDMADFNPNEEN